MKRIYIVLVSIIFSVLNSNSQTIIGEVRDIDGIGIANVLIQDPENPFSFTKTIKGGKFSTITLTENLVVEIRAFGYQTKIVNLKNNQIYILEKDLSFSSYIYHNDVDFVRAGIYTKDECKVDFQTTWANGFAELGGKEITNRVSIDPNENVDGTGKSIKIWYPKGKVDSKESGAQWRVNLNGEFDDLYLSYWVKFSPNFDFTLGGKLPGFDGSEGGYASNTNSWSGKIMWRENGQAEFYLHPPGARNKEQFWWNNLGKTATFKRGVWQNIQIHYKLNDVGRKNGLLEAWLDGVLVGNIQNTDVFRRPGEEKIMINNVFFSTFFGGDITFAPTKEEYAWFDKFTVSKSKISFPTVIPNPIVITELQEDFVNSKSSLIIYPNPSENGLFQLSESTDWIILSPTGNELKFGHGKQLDLSDNPKGIYLIKTGEAIQKVAIE